MRSVLRRVALAALVFTIAGTAGACQQRHEGAIDVTVIGEEQPQIVDPAAGPLTVAQEVLLVNVAQGLVRFDARGEIEPGLAERWNVTDDGLSYIFRLSPGEWPNGDRITAHQVARILRRQVARGSRNAFKDALGSIEEIVSMTDRVLEIRLNSPRANLLQLLAQPEFGLVRDGAGTGPFRVAKSATDDRLRLERTVEAADGEENGRDEEVLLASAPAPEAVRAFAAGETDLVLGGRYADLPYARTPGIANKALRFDPVSGLFGLVPARANGPLEDVELRRLLSQAIDRQAIIDALQVPALLPRVTLLEPKLDGIDDPVPPEWAAIPIVERRDGLAAWAQRLFGDEERPVLRIALPDAPGAAILFNHLQRDWGALGIGLERAEPGTRADIEVVDEVAPSSSPSWFLRQLRCGIAAICDQEADSLLDAARVAPVAAQRSALLAEAGRKMEEAQLFVAIAAPVRWSLVSDFVEGFAGNRFAVHTLTALDERLNPERAE